MIINIIFIKIIFHLIMPHASLVYCSKFDQCCDAHWLEAEQTSCYLFWVFFSFKSLFCIKKLSNCGETCSFHSLRWYTRSIYRSSTFVWIWWISPWSKLLVFGRLCGQRQTVLRNDLSLVGIQDKVSRKLFSVAG